MKKNYNLNDPREYHLNDLETLGWELTVCNCLETPNSFIQKILEKSNTFGNLLFNFLEKFINFDQIENILEVGGGYGFLMRDFLSKKNHFKATMLDISPFLINKQNTTLKNKDLNFIQQDFLSTEQKFLKNFDLLILNENLGDFPTICDLNPSIFNKKESLDSLEKKIKFFIDKYSLELNSNQKNNLNIGAWEILEKICQAKVKNIYLSEHSCEAEIPNQKPSLNPEKISLKGHHEYTLNFSFLEKIAKFYGYHSVRGQYLNFIKIKKSDKINFILNSNTDKDEHEIIRHFVYDLHKYEYLILQRCQV